ncbi:RHS repeat domain-containing protein [Variovorax sp. tm]|uniref:RHS repeat domain-containing protein n=1 Tax=Variovorax atrisoli TaxID=3394203 RepID=UPI003A805C9D
MHRRSHARQKYDPAGRLLEQHISRTRPGAIESTTGIQRRYTYDKAGQLVTIGDSRRGSLNYRYDPVGRLLEAHSRLGRETFAFDPAGNIVDPPPANDLLRHPAGKLLDNLLKNYAGTSYRYDERGNMTERVRNGWRTVFAWDGFNRMTAATDHSGITTTFSYDALGRRLSKSSGDTHDPVRLGRRRARIREHAEQLSDRGGRRARLERALHPRAELVRAASAAAPCERDGVERDDGCEGADGGQRRRL